MKKLLLGASLVLLSVQLWAKGVDAVRTEILLKTSTSWNGVKLPAYPEGTPEITIQKFTIPPKFQLPLHKHTVINAGVLLSGNLVVTTENGKTLHLAAGDSIAEVVNTWHFGRNDGDEPVEIIVVYAGIEGKPITIKK